MSLLLKELSNTKDLRKVATLQLGIFNPELIKRGSVCEVLTADTYDGNEPKINGLFDPRMGVIDDGRLCASCENKRELCPGHFGHIELSLPVFHIHFVSQILKLLQCICFRCSKLLIDKNNPILLENLVKKSGKNRFSTIYNESQKVNICKYNNGCHVMQPSRYLKVSVDKITEKDNIIKIFAEFKQEALKSQNTKRQQMVSPELCYEIFRRISNEDCTFLGFSNTFARPEWMICTVLSVPPPQVRPSVKQDNNQRSEDDLTFALAMIVKANNMLKDKIKSQCTKNVIESYHGLLQYMIATYIDNELPGVPQSAQRSRRALKTIIQRLKGKDGRFRGNLMGKRVDFSARTVISVDPNIDIDEFGVPEKLAMELTFPEIVTKYNIKKMYTLLRNGPYKHPGAISVKKMKYDCLGNPAPCTIRLEFVDPSTIVLNYGDIVNRHIQDGDVCLFNRQPSLHRMSMMGHKVRVIKYNTFRLNVLVCKPYNADFDGDEMNMHVPQSYQTMYELKHITLVPTQIISPATSKPVMGIVQDTLVGSYLITDNDVKITKQQLQNYIMPDKNFTGIIPEPDYPGDDENEPMWSGRQVFSLIVPEISLKKDDVVITNGNVVSGNLGKSILGGSAGGLIQFVYNQYGVETCKNFLDNVQKLVTRWLSNNGFTMGFGDAIVDKNTNKSISARIDEGISEANKLIEEAHQGVYKPNLDKKYMMGSLNGEILISLRGAVEAVSSIIQKVLPLTNNFMRAVTSGSKGEKINLNQIMGCVGQQDIWGDRVPFGFTDRTLPHFHKLDNGAMSRGFVKSSYISGLSPSEFFFSAMGGRVGLIDTAIKTAESGYIQRRLVKATEDLQVGYDTTVRNTNGNIVQFTYGDDGMDPLKVELQKLSLIDLDDFQMEQNYKLEIDELLTASLMPDVLNEMTSTQGYEDVLEREYNNIVTSRHNLRYNYFKYASILTDVSFLSPVNYFRLIPATINKFSLKPFDISDLNPLYIIEQVDKLCDEINNFSNTSSHMHLFIILTKTFLSSKKCILQYKLNKIVFDYLINIIKNKVIKSYIQAGELVGPLAAQSIGEPLTQMTLNTFHLAGVGSVVTTSGVPRIKEIINISKKIKTPSVTIYLEDEYSTDQAKVLTIMKQLEYTRLEDVILKSQIIYEQNIAHGLFEEDLEFISIYHAFNDLIEVDIVEDENLSRWVLRFEFDKESMMNRNIQMADVQEAILYNCNSDNDIQCIFSDDNSGHLILRIRVRQDTEDGNYISFLQELEKCIITMTLRGIPNITKVGCLKEKKVVYDCNGKGKQIEEYILNTEGTNLLDILNNEYVDYKRTITNDIYEIFLTFGIEGARTAIINELTKTITAGHAAVDYRHVSILADTMTYKGYLMQIDRHGINRSSDTGPIAKASFEEVSDIIISAASFAEKDKLNGVSGNIVMGQVPHAGTNSFDIMFDEQKMMSVDITDYQEEPLPNSNSNSNTTKSGIPTYNNVMDIIDETFKETTIEQEINDSSFEFGYTINSMQEYKLPNTLKPVVPIKIIGTETVSKKIIIRKKIIKPSTSNSTSNATSNSTSNSSSNTPTSEQAIVHIKKDPPKTKKIRVKKEKKDQTESD